MKIFVYKLLITLFFLFIFFELTIGSRIDYFKDTLNSLKDPQTRIAAKEKIKTEMRKAIEKENYLNEEERYLINNFLKKIREELKSAENN